MDNVVTLFVNVVIVCLFSAVIIVRELISARLQKAVQSEYDGKLESLKAELQKKSDEHKTQFHYWHAEKAAAIKDVYGSICDLFSDIKILEAVDLAPTWKENENRESTRIFFKERIISSSNETVRKWLKLKLFLDDKDDSKLGEFQYKTIYLLLLLFSPENVQKTDPAEIEKCRGELLVDLERIIETLRKSFQDTLRCYSAKDMQISCSEGLELQIKKTSAQSNP